MSYKIDWAITILLTLNFGLSLFTGLDANIGLVIIFPLCLLYAIFGDFEEKTSKKQKIFFIIIVSYFFINSLYSLWTGYL
jgi:hypothetical protein